MRTKFGIYVFIFKNGLTKPKGVNIICKSKKDRQHNDHKKNVKSINNDLQNIHMKL